MYAFGDFVLDTQLFQLRHRDHVIPLEPKVFDVLRYLVEHSDRVATKRELLSALWPNEAVSEAVLPTNINALRRALGQQRGEKLPIETIHGRGYRFALPVVKTLPPRASARPSSHLGVPPSLELENVDEDTLFVGQATLLSRLKRCLVRALAEQGQACVLSGEAGIGKTRVARSIAELARAHGADVWMGVCPEAPGAPPLWVWQQIVRSALHAEGVDTLRRWLGPSVSELVPWLPELGEGQGEGPAEAGDDRSYRMFDAIVRLLTQASLTRPRVLWLEDMHRADDASWQLLSLLTPHLERAAVLVLVNLRSRDDLTVAAPVQRNLDTLLRVPFSQCFHVRGLDEADTQALVERIVGHGIESEVARKLHEKTGGNPLFVRELVEWLEARGGTDIATLAEAPDLAPPEMVRHVLRRRVVRLGNEARQVLEAGAVLGSMWDVASIEHVAGLSRDTVLAAVDGALRQRVITPVPGRVEAYRFAHALLRDTLYADLPINVRQRMHLQAAGCFEERLAFLGSDAVHEVAHHYYRALPEAAPSLAIQWLRRAAEDWEERGVFDAAVRCYRFALDATRLLAVAAPELRESLSAARTRASELARTSLRRAQA